MTELKQSLIKLLRDNSRYTLDELAAFTGANEADIKTAMRELEESGAIVKYSTIFNDDVLEREVVEALIEVRVTPQKNRGFDAIAEDIYGFKEVKSLYLMSGGYDLTIIVECKTLRAVANFVSERLATLDTVLSTATHFILKKYKVDGTIIGENQEGSKRLTFKL